MRRHHSPDFKADAVRLVKPICHASAICRSNVVKKGRFLDPRRTVRNHAIARQGTFGQGDSRPYAPASVLEFVVRAPRIVMGR